MVLPILRGFLKDEREHEATDGGVFLLAVCKSLEDLQDTKALPLIRKWKKVVDTSPRFSEMRDTLPEALSNVIKTLQKKQHEQKDAAETADP